MIKNLEKPHSLIRKRVEQFLPKFRKRKGKWKLITSSVKMVKPEAEYIMFLDMMYTSSELCAMLLGRVCFSDGMKLVTLAENQLRKNNENDKRNRKA